MQLSTEFRSNIYVYAVEQMIEYDWEKKVQRNNDNSLW